MRSLLEVAQASLHGEWWWQQGSAWLQHSLLKLQGPPIPQPLVVVHREGDHEVTEHWQMKVKWLAGRFNSFASLVLSAYFLNKSKTALMSYMTKQNAESFLVHHLFSCRGNLLSSPSQPITAFTTFLQGWQWLEKIMRLIRENSMFYVIRSVLSILLVSGCFTGNGKAAFCSTQTIFFFFFDCKYKVQLCCCQQKRWFSLKAAGACLGCGTVVLSPVSCSCRKWKSSVLLQRRTQLVQERELLENGAEQEMKCLLNVKWLIISAFFKTEMVKCHHLKGAPSYKTWTHLWKL